MAMSVPTHISSMELSGFKSIKQEQLVLDKLNIFIGSNGSGKTNFISFLGMLSSILRNPGSLDDYVSRHGGAEYLLHFGSKQTKSIKAKLTMPLDMHEVVYSVELCPSISDSLYFQGEMITYDEDDREPLIQIRGGGKNSLFHENSTDGVIGQYYHTIYSLIRILGEIRLYQFHDTSPDALIRKSAYMDENTHLLGNGGNLGAFLYMLREKYPGDYRIIIDIIRQAAPFVGEIILEKDYNSCFVKLRWRENTNSSYRFDVSQLSDGTLRFIALVTALAQPNLPPVICIDEPELGLHPEAVSVIADLLKLAAERSQVFVATQSPALVDCFDARDIIVVNRQQGETCFERLAFEKYQEWLNEYSLSAVWRTNIFGGNPRV